MELSNAELKQVRHIIDEQLSWNWNSLIDSHTQINSCLGGKSGKSLTEQQDFLKSLDSALDHILEQL